MANEVTLRRGLNEVTLGGDRKFQYDDPELSTASEFSKGWRSSSIGIEAGEFYLASLQAEKEGRKAEAEFLKSRGDELSKQATARAPEITSVRNVEGLGDAATWAGGAMGSGLRSTLGTAGGALAGAAGGFAVAGPAGAVAGGALGGFGGGFDAARGENAANYVNDKELYGKKSAGELLDRINAVSAGQAALDVAGLGVSALGRRVVTKELAKGSAKNAAAKRFAEAGAAEGATGGAQSVIGQYGQNSLAGREEKVDWGKVADDAAAEAVGGFGIAAPSALYQAGRTAITPSDTTGNPAADAGVKVGEAGAKILNSVESALARRRDPIEADQDFLNVTKPIEGSDEEVLAQLDARRASALNLSEKIARNKSSTQEQLDAAESFASRLNQASTPQEQDALVNEFSAALGGAVTKEKDKKSFFDAFKDFIAPPLDRKYNAMEPGQTGFDEDSDTVTPQILQLWQTQLAKDYPALRADMNDPEVQGALSGLARWVKEGGRTDGAPVLPTSLTQALGSKSSEAISQLSQLMYDQGLIDARTKRINERVVQHLDKLGKMSDRSVGTVKAALTPLVKSELGDRVDDHARDMYMILSKLADGELQNTEAGNAELLRQFGSQEKLNGLLEAFKGETDERAALHEQYVLDVESGTDSEADVGEGDDLGYEEKQVSFEEREASDGARVKFHGPFDLAVDTNRERLSKRAANLAGQDSSASTSTVGAWDMLKEEHSANPDQLAVAEADLLVKHNVRVDAGDIEGRTRALNLLNRRLRYVREEVPDGRDGLDKIDGVTPFLDKTDKNGNLPDGSMQNGRIHLEFTDYETKKSVDQETGEEIRERVPVLKFRQVPVSKLIAHANRSGEPVTAASGAKAVADKFMAGLGALLASGNGFTGRMQFIEQESGRKILVERGGQIPGGLMLLKGDSKNPPIFMKDAGHPSAPSKRAKAMAKAPGSARSATMSFEPSDFPNMTDAELEAWVANAREKLDKASPSTAAWLRDSIALAEDYINGDIEVLQSERDEKSINYKDKDRETLRDQDAEGVINRADDGNVAVPTPSGALTTGLSSKAKEPSAPVLKAFKPSAKQLAWAVEQVKKSIPGLVAKVKDMTAIQGQAIRATLKYMVDNPQQGLNPATVERAYEKVIEVTQRVKPAETKSISSKDIAKRSRRANAQREAGKAASPETQAEVKAEMLKILGPKVEVAFQKFVKMGGKKVSGEWSEKGIKISLYANSPHAVARHEAVHQLFQWLNEQGAVEMRDMLQNVASSAPIKNQLRRLLKDHPEAIKQLDDPEEAAAYLYQFWREGKINLGPKAETFFQKVAKFLQDVYSAVSGYVTDEQHAEKIMQAFTDGEFADANEASISAYEQVIGERQRDFATRVSEAFAQNSALKKFVFTAGNVMRDTKIPSIVELADQLYTQEGDAMKGQAYFDAVPQQRAIWLNKLNRILKDVEKEDAAAALEFLQAETETSAIGDPVVKKLVADIRGFYDDIFDNYLQKKGVKRFNEEKGAWEPVAKIKRNYFTRVWDADKIAGDTQAFVDDLMKSNAKELEALAEKYQTTPEEVAKTVANRLISANGEPTITESGSELGITPFAAAVNKRDLTWIDPANMKQWMNKDIASILTNYTVQAVKRAEYVERFGNEGEKIQQALDDAFLYQAFKGDEAKIAATKKAHEAAVAEHFKKGGKAENKPSLFADVEKAIGFNAAVEIRESMKPVIQSIMAAEGTLGREIDAMMRQAFGAVAVFEQVRLLALSLFSSFVDPLGMIIRGGTMQDAWEGFVRGVREVKLGWQSKTSDDAWAKYAEDIGTVDASAYLDALGQTYSSLYMHGKLKKISDGLFKWNGMEAWNRAMRIQATKAAAGFIETHLKTPNEHSKRYLKELSLAADGDYMKNGQLDLENDQVQRAIVRWTNGAILRPNAMQRPIYASDPHYALFYQLKQFTYSFHKTILRRAYVEAQHGNFMPSTALFTTYVPMMIAADVVKALLTPGEEPAWMKQGLGAYVEHGVMRANLLGIPQFGIEMLDGVSLTDPLKTVDKATRILGPAPEHVVDWMMVPLTEEHSFGRELVRSAPGMTVYGRAVLD